MYRNKQTGFGIVGTQIIIVSKKRNNYFFSVLYNCRYLVIVFACFVFFELEQSRFRVGKKHVLKFLFFSLFLYLFL